MAQADPPPPRLRNGLDNTLVFTILMCVSAVLRALQTPRRREILRLVWNGERTAGEIHRAFGDVTFGAVSQHLRVLAEAGLVTQRSEGRHRWYRARKPGLGRLRAWLESQWDSALARLQIEAELEAARRGPRPAPRGSTRKQPQPRTSQTRTSTTKSSPTKSSTAQAVTTKTSKTKKRIPR